MTDFTYYKPWVLFWVCAALAHGYMDYSLVRKVRSWQRGETQAAGRRWSGRTARIWLEEVFLQRQLFAISPSRWLVHMLIFWGFLCLAALSMSLFLLSLAQLAGLDGGLRQYLTAGPGHAFVKIWGDGFGLCLLAGLLAASARRFFGRPSQLLSDQSDTVLLLFLIWLTVSGFVLEGLRIGQVHPDIARYSFAARWLAAVLPGLPSGAETILPAAWIVHAFSGLGLLVYLPKSKLMHSLLGPVVIALNAAEEPHRKDVYWPRIRDHRPTE